MLKNNILFLFLFITSIFISVSCMRKVEKNSLVSITLPSGVGSSKLMTFENSEPMSFQSVSTQSEGDGPDWNTALNPTALSDINCYMIAITAPEPDMRRNICTTTTGQNFFVGRWRGGIPAGGTLSLEIPSGKSREIIILGIKAQSIDDCKDFRMYQVESANLSEPHIIGKVTKDLNPGPVTVDIPISMTNAVAMDDCNGPDFNMNHGPQMYFGDAPSSASHSAVVTAPTDISSGVFATNLRGAYSRLLNIDPLAAMDRVTVDIHASATYSHFQPGNEVMLMVMGGNGSFRTPSHAENMDYDSCGYKSWKGRYGFARIMSAAGTTLTLTRGTFLDGIVTDLNDDEITDNNDRAALTARLGTAANMANFCYIQMIKIPHFYNLTIQSSGEISTPPFDYSNNGGGVLAFRVSNELNMSSVFPLNMTDKGYRGRMGFNGDGVMGGQATSCSHTATTMTGGGCGGSASESGAGGGHGNQNSVSPWGPSGGRGYPAIVMGGTGNGENCGDGSCFGNLNFKMFMGGAGGGRFSSELGGHGGGILYAVAKNITVPAVVNIKAAAVSPSGTATGGGAGGSVNLSYKTINNKDNLQIHAYGGNGGIWATYGGGGGGGGRVQVTACKLGTVPQSPSIITASAGLAPAVANTGSAGETGTVVKYDVDCP